MDTINKASNKQLNRCCHNVESKEQQKSKPNNWLRPNINLTEYPEYPNGRKVQKRSISRPKPIVSQTSLVDLFPIQNIENRQVVAHEVTCDLNSSKNAISLNSESKKTTKLSRK